MKRLVLVLLMLFAFGSHAESVDIDVIALFKDAALLEINGKRQMLRLGEASTDGVLLVSAHSREAIVEVGGERVTLNLSDRIGSSFEPRQISKVSINLNDNGQYRTGGSINGQPVIFLVDTGANVVAMNVVDARNLDIQLSSESEAMSVTAGGVIRSWEVNLEVVQVGEIRIHNVKAAVLEGEYPEHILLGMTFLSNVEMSESSGVMVLTSKF
jgi:aspartyl protease family protein